MRPLVLPLLTCCACGAQSIAIGAIGGGRITADVLTFPSPEANGLRAGSAFRLESRFYDVGTQGFFSTFYHDTQYNVSGERDNIREFPWLLKYNLRWWVLHPFVEAGVAPRTISGKVVGTFPASYGPSVGFVASGGLQFNRGRLRLAPQVRYTRWGTAPVGGVYYSVGSTYSSNQNQLDVLVGISWRVR